MIPDDAVQLSESIRRRKLSSLEATQYAIQRIELLNPLINAVVATRFDQAIAEAAEADRTTDQQLRTRPLHGVPVLVKDLFDFMPGMPNTFGCRAFWDHHTTDTSLHIQRLQSAGAIILGRTNTPEFGHKGITDNTLFGPTRCVFDLARNAGGSSGGSAAAVAAGLVTLAQGSDAGGSVRIPAAWSGVVGFKPTFGRIPITRAPNAFAHHTPFVHIGTLTRSVKDAALMAEVLSGFDPHDPLCLATESGLYARGLDQVARQLRVGYWADWGVMAIDPAVRSTMDSLLADLRAGGLQVQDVRSQLPLSQEDLADLWVRQVGLAYAEMFESMSQKGEDVLASLGDDVPEQIHQMVADARGMSALESRRDELKRTEVWNVVAEVFAKFDLIVTPTLSTTPVPNASDGRTLGPALVDGRSVERTIGWCLTHPINFTGHPAISVPAGLNSEGLPVGCQIVGRRLRDDQVLCLAAEIERIRPWLSFLVCATEALELEAKGKTL